MNIQGLDYNTRRDALVMPEYGREIQKMVDYAMTLPDKAQRLVAARSIVRLMEVKSPQIRDNENYQQTLWDHLYLISRKQLDIDWPYDVAGAEKILAKPEPMRMPRKGDHVHLRHYGHLLEEVFQRLKEMPEGRERDELVAITANHMKRDLATWSHGSMDDEKVADDLARLTDGKIQLDLRHFRFDPVGAVGEPMEGKKKKKK